MCHFGQVKRCDQDVTKLQNTKHNKTNINRLIKEQDVIKNELLAKTTNIVHLANSAKNENDSNKYT